MKSRGITGDGSKLIIFLGLLQTVHSFSSLDHIHPNTTPSIQSQSAREALETLLGPHASRFQLQVHPNIPRNTFTLFKNDSMDYVQITASDGVSALRGVNHYLEDFLYFHISWDVQTVNISESTKFPPVQLTSTSSSRFTYYQNVCTWSYSFAWWTWEEWRRHIYWMAMQGINLALAPVQELVWREIYTDLGMTEEEIVEDFSGPAFFAWQRMGNIRGWGGPLPLSFMERSAELQQKIIQLSNSLGISLALPAFAGHVPLPFKRLFPNATFSPVVRWNRFEDRYCCPLFLDPLDPLFKDLQRRFLNKSLQLFGTNHIYFADPFNEINPQRNDTEYMASVSRGIYQSMVDVDPKAVWLLQGWMFVKNPFWADEMIKAFLTSVPRGGFLVLDLQSDQHPQYERTQSYYGQPFIWCMLHNFGGTIDIHGSISVVNQRISHAKAIPNSSMVGVGITPEGIFQNYAMYEFALKQAWKTEEYDLELWLNSYARRRYGVADGHLEGAMQILRTTAYGYFGLDKISGRYAVCRRPTANFASMSWYEYSNMEDVWELMLNSSATSEAFYQDLVDVTRQALQNKGEDLYTVIIQAYEHGETEAVEQMGEHFLDLLHDMDRILSTHKRFLLGPWLESAKALAETDDDEEQELFEQNARAQITTWGPNGEINDYATKQWSGLFRDYFVKRWTVFFEEMLKAMRGKRRINTRKVTKKILYTVEIPFIYERTEYPVEVSGEDPREVSKELFGKWANNFANFRTNVSVFLV